MAIATWNDSPYPPPSLYSESYEEPANGIATALLILATATMYLSPASVFPSLASVPMYLIVFAFCLFTCLPSLFAQFSAQSLVQSPTTVCLMFLLPLVPLAHLVHGQLDEAWNWGSDYVKSFLYYLAVTSLLSRPAQMRHFLFWLAIVIALVVAIGALDYHGVIRVESIRQCEQKVTDEVTGERAVAYLRMRSVNLFHDPGALGMLIGTGMVICLYFLTSKEWPGSQLFFLLLLGYLGWAFTLTHSKVGFVTIAVALAAMLVSRFKKKGIILLFLVFPVLFAVFAGRATSLSVNDESAQDRIDLWDRGIPYFRAHPFIGIGTGQYKEEMGQQAHNSFWEPYVEMGAAGGTLFLGAFCFIIVGLFRVRHVLPLIPDAEMARFWPYLIGILVGNAIGMHTQPRTLVMPTYTLLGMAAAYLRMVSFQGIVPIRWSSRNLLRLSGFSVLYVLGTYVFIRLCS